MMNAGTSPSGRKFAIDLSDMHFDAVRTPDEDSVRVAESKRLARTQGRSLQVWTPIGIVCRPSQREAEEFTAHIIGYADLGAVGNLQDLHRRDAKDLADNVSAFAFSGEGPVERRVLARGNYCAIGDPDRVASLIGGLQRVGFDGLALNFVNYLDEFPYFVQEVLPRLEALGVRRK
jgi:alkanesulfonate monooxygenase SsuD/methylene tetrahydromethanopterin reductase-like flavin-dependent oxidoreductase (luciferase family)